MNDPENNDYLDGVAIIGMAGRFPGAKNIEEFWQNIENGIEGITLYSDRELEEAGISNEALMHPDYVKAKGEVQDVDMFDASFFGINPREAEVTDPQHRMLLECAWEALEHAGYDSGKFDGTIGVYAGKSMDYYLLLNVYPRIRKEISAGSLQAAIGNDKDSLTTTISYRLNLTGPAITIQTSSSTSLVAVCVACQSLLTYQCDLALSGGITAGPPIKSGYLYQEGNIWSPDGHCRAFSANARGFVPGSGMGLVVLKRLEDAVRDNDTIWAVIKGFAVNNDGYNKVSYSAPSVDAQAEVVAQALASADFHPETIQYIETHGTGTNLGDPIEIAALNQVFRAYTEKRHYCAVGSVKSNIGHLDTAAGIAGLIKVALSLKHKKIPASLHFEKPNPKIDFENSPFFVNTGLKEWQVNRDTNGNPLARRAGVTSLGMGGTNAHVVMEEWPDAPIPVNSVSDIRIEAGEGRGEFSSTEKSGEHHYQLILLSAQTETGLEKMTKNLANCLKTTPGIILSDVAYTLKIGRRDFNYRRMAICREPGDAVNALEELTPGIVSDSECDIVERPVVFMFPGQGSQYVNMAGELYEKEPVFKENMDKCAAILTPLLGIDPLEVLYPGLYTSILDIGFSREEDLDKNKSKNKTQINGEIEEEIIKRNTGQLRQTWLTQPVLLMLEYSLSRMWMEWGIKPAAMIGHSIGEFTAACIAGCISLEDALRLAVIRGCLMHEQEKGTMLSVDLDETELTHMVEMLDGHLSLAAVNSPGHCVVSGKTEEIVQLEKQLTEKNIFHRRLHTSHAFHSAMMEPIMKEFAEAVEQVELNPPSIPFISGVTGTWIQVQEVCNPEYWAQQLRQTVRFSDGIREIMRGSSGVFLEVGPGSSLGVLTREHSNIKSKTESGTGSGIFSSIRHIKQTGSDMAFVLKTLGNLWLSGVVVDWKGFYKNERCRRVPLPAYPYERKLFWLEVKGTGPELEMERELEEKAGNEELRENLPESTDKKKQETEPQKTYQSRPKLNNEYEAASDELDQQLVEMWEDILGIKPIGINDNFFDLGGHSLLATLFLSQLLEKFGTRLELQSIFESPTIATIGQLLKAELNKTANQDDLENILSEIEGLSQDELRNALPDENQDESEMSK